MNRWCSNLSKHVTALLAEILPLARTELLSSGVKVPLDARAVDLSGALMPRRGVKRGWRASLHWRTSQSFVMKLQKMGEQRSSDVSIVEEMHYRGPAEPKRLPGDEAGIIGDWINGIAGAESASEGKALDGASLAEAAAFAFDPSWGQLYYSEGRGEISPSLSIWTGGRLRRFGRRFAAHGDGVFSDELRVALDSVRDGRVHASQHAGGRHVGAAVFIGPPPLVRRVNDRNPIEILRVLSKLPPGACLLD